jgi:glucoamylase
VQVGTFGPSDALYNSVIERLRTTGDDFLEVVKSHVDVEGSMSEQFDRVTGYMRGARDLTWSYGAFLGAVRARKMARDA